MATTQTQSSVTLKLLVHKQKNKVLFGEAGKDFVDALFSFLTLPLGTIASLVGKESNLPPVRVGCLTTLYESVAKLDPKQCLSSEICEEMLLHPRNPMELYRRQLKLNVDDTESLNYFNCSAKYCDESSSNDCVSAFRNLTCYCGNLMDRADPPNSWKLGKSNGFVLETASFIICDDLYVMPNVLESSMTLLQNHGIQDMDAVEEQTVTVSKNEILDLLKCSSLSKTPLTDVFLTKNRTLDNFNQWNPGQLKVGEVPNDSDMNINVKALVRKSTKQILLVQAEEDFADFILSFLALPLGGALNLLQQCSSHSCLDHLYKSVNGLNGDRYFMSNQIKDGLINPRITYMFDQPILLPINVERSPYVVPCEQRKFANYDILAAFRTKTRGFARGPSTFMVTDDLVVSPMSSCSCLSILSGAKIPVRDLEQRVVSVGLKEGLSILKASLISESALTNGLHQLVVTTIQRPVATTIKKKT